MHVSPLKRGLWFAALAVLLAAGGGLFYFLTVVLVDDRRRSFPSLEGPLSDTREVRVDWTSPPPAFGSAPRRRAWEGISALRTDHPEASFEWVGGKPGVARVTLSDPPGRTCLEALAAEDGDLYEWAGVVPAGASLEFRIGILSSGPGFRFLVERIDERGDPQRLFSETVLPRRHQALQGWAARLPRRRRAALSDVEHPDERWIPFRVDVSAWAGRLVRIRLRVEAIRASARPGPALALWGAPALWSSSEVPPPSRSRGNRLPSRSSVVLVALENAPGDGVGLEESASGVPPRLRELLRESVAFSRFYTTDTRTPRALAHLFHARRDLADPLAAPSMDPAWPRALAALGYRTLAVGPFDASMVALLSGAGFDEIHALPHDGYDPLLASNRALAWARDGGRRGPVLVFVWFRDPPRRRWSPARFWALSLRRFPWSRSRWVLWRESTDAAYLDDTLGRLAEKLRTDRAPPLLALVSLRGSAAMENPVRWPRTGRRGTLFWSETGLGLREREIRTVFALRHPALNGPVVVTLPAQLVDVGPTILGALGVPRPAGDGRACDLGGGPLPEDSNARVVVRAPRAKALIIDGRFKYVRHAPPEPRRVRTAWWCSSFVRTDWPAEEIFDLWTDPGEGRNLARSRRDLLGRLRSVMEEADPDPVEVRLGFVNPHGARVDGVVTCSAGRIDEVGGTVPIVRRGSYEWFFSVSAASGTVRFLTWPPESSYMMHLVFDGRYLPVEQWRISRLGLPLFESVGDEWHDQTKFGWMDGWVPPIASSSAPIASLGRVSVWVDEGFAEKVSVPSALGEEEPDVSRLERPSIGFAEAAPLDVSAATPPASLTRELAKESPGVLGSTRTVSAPIPPAVSTGTVGGRP